MLGLAGLQLFSKLTLYTHTMLMKKKMVFVVKRVTKLAYGRKSNKA